MDQDYPDVICTKCAESCGKIWTKGHIATFYEAVCGICGNLTICTESRDWLHFTDEEVKIMKQKAKERNLGK
jgi:hypothetical protein